MPLPRDDLNVWLNRVRTGEPEAVRAFIERYGDVILTTVRRRLPRQLRTLYDSDDCVHLVWLRLLGEALVGRTFASGEEVGRFVFGLASDVVHGIVRDHLDVQKRDLRRQQRLRESEKGDLPARTPTPFEVAAADDEWERLLQGALPHHRYILELVRAGHTQAEIARKLGINEKMVYRALRRAWLYWREGESA